MTLRELLKDRKIDVDELLDTEIPGGHPIAIGYSLDVDHGMEITIRAGLLAGDVAGGR